MKKVLFLMIAAFAPLLANAQDELDSLLNSGYELTRTYTEDEIATHAEMPEFPGGTKALYTFMRKTLKYPSKAVQYGFEGSAIIKFAVEKDGSLSNIRVDKCEAVSKSDKYLKLSEEKQQKLKEKVVAQYTKEGLRLVRKMPKWKPARLDGELKRVGMTLPIRFVGY